DVGDDEYELYSTLIESQCMKPAIKRIVIQNQTIDGFSGSLFGDKLESWNKYMAVERGTLDDFASKAGRNELLSERFKLSVPYSLISLESFKEILLHNPINGWDAFYAKYPDSAGCITFSRVGFNKKKDQALVYVDIGRYVRNSEGSYMLFIKENGRWVLKQKRTVLQS